MRFTFTNAPRRLSAAAGAGPEHPLKGEQEEREGGFRGMETHAAGSL